MESLNKDELWLRLMRWGEACGCHQMPERSFFIGGYQFPVCARCTGVFAGKALAYMLLALGAKIRPALCAAMILCMGADWFAQYIGLRESNNARRFITGIMAGAGAVFLFVNLIIYIRRL